MTHLYECVACLHRKRTRIKPLYCEICSRPDTYSIIDEFGKRSNAVSALDISAEEPERFPTGDENLDSALLGGFVRPATLTAFGVAGVGKSRSCLRWACRLGPALLVSLEMPMKLAVLSARGARANLDQLFITESEEDWQSEAQRVKARVIVFDSFHYSQKQRVRQGTKVPQICWEASEWAKENDGLVFMIAHQNKKNRVSGTTAVEHWPDYLFRFKKHGQSEAEIIIPKARYSPSGSAIVTI